MNVDNVENFVSKKRETLRFFGFSTLFSTSYQHSQAIFSTREGKTDKNTLFRAFASKKRFFPFFVFCCRSDALPSFFSHERS